MTLKITDAIRIIEQPQFICPRFTANAIHLTEQMGNRTRTCIKTARSRYQKFSLMLNGFHPNSDLAFALLKVSDLVILLKILVLIGALDPKPSPILAKIRAAHKGRALGRLIFN